jgi:GNAT superfamily N-acetyltransferase
VIGFAIRFAERSDAPAILSFIRQLAEYERLSDVVTATEELIVENLFGPRATAEVLLGLLDGSPVAFAVFFHNFSTFLAKRGLYLEDLFVSPEMRGHGFGKAMLIRLAEIAIERDCGRLEWAVLDWNEPAIRFYNNVGAVPLDDWTTFRVTGEALQKLAGKQSDA